MGKIETFENIRKYSKNDAKRLKIFENIRKFLKIFEFLLTVENAENAGSFSYGFRHRRTSYTDSFDRLPAPIYGSSLIRAGQAGQVRSGLKAALRQEGRVRQRQINLPNDGG